MENYGGELGKALPKQQGIHTKSLYPNCEAYIPQGMVLYFPAEWLPLLALTMASVRLRLEEEGADKEWLPDQDPDIGQQNDSRWLLNEQSQ